MPQLTYDIIVAGTGSMGAAACYYLAKKGYRVLGLEQFESTPHDKGSHGGQSRIIRKAYFEHPDYVPLLNRAYTNWLELEEESGEQLYHKTGLLYGGPADHTVISGVQHASSLYNIPVERVNDKNRFPFFNLPGEYKMLFEPDAGFLLPGRSISLLVREAKKRGATIHTGEKLIGWEKEQEEIIVITTKKKYSTKKLIVTTGAWALQVLKELQVPLKVTRQVLLWVKPNRIEDRKPPNFPCWLIADNRLQGVYYGFPYLNGKKYPGPTGLKFGLHFPGKVTHPDNVDRVVSDLELRDIVNAVKNYFPLAGSPIVNTTTCLYTNTPDENFIIDHLPGSDNIIIACGFSGHGFKFVPVIGELLADLATEGSTALPIGFLGLDRFGK